MISKTKIVSRTKAKRNSELIEIVNLARKNNLLNLAKRISAPRSQYNNININDLGKINGEEIVVVGKVLGSGDIKRKITIAALNFSESAKDKLNKAGCDIVDIKEVIRNNPLLEGVVVI